MEGKLIIFSAPSGSGKTTIVKQLLANNPNLGFSISACTRDKRGRSEQDGQDYYFLTPDEFRTKIDEDAFVEWEEVYPGAYYGTLKSEIERIWASGKHVIFDVDVKGGLALKNYYKERALAVFVKVPSLEILEDRLRSRGTETEESLSKRIFKMKFEWAFQDKFDVILVNDQLADAVKEAQRLFDELTH
ncbi:guanylate kinase [Aquirufa sp. OSTEICH-129V]|uniref:Guanylate kinase n=1 Tax=Aquirufa avitistagni TaxID=3104728 RepID=A0ABW6DFC9_9BACT